MMMKTTTKLVFLTVEIAVEFMSLQIGAQNVNALKEVVEGAMEKLQQLLELQLVQAVIKVGSLMGIVMISTIMLAVYLMVEIVVDLM